MKIRSTTVLTVRRGGQVAMGGDGQVTLGDTIVKKSATKVRRLYDDKILVGFAGATADAFALLERLEAMLKKYNGNLLRAATELAKEWRMDKVLRRLESLIIAVDKDHSLLLSGSGDVIEPEDGIIGIGSGGQFAVAAARALLKHTQLPARDIVEEAMRISSGICIFTNEHLHVEVL